MPETANKTYAAYMANKKPAMIECTPFRHGWFLYLHFSTRFIFPCEIKRILLAWTKSDPCIFPEPNKAFTEGACAPTKPQPPQSPNPNQGACGVAAKPERRGKK